ncbi:hypothetical protein [Stella sp.]|uniref:hypothetical protein n=1 Tax=Stella sp. TaxID=2912054 RepID=UPI0035B23492
MHALFRLLAVGRLAASARTHARLAGLRAAFAAAVLALSLAGIAFLVAAGYQWLRWRLPAPEASAIVGGGFLVLALLVAVAGYLVVRRQRRRTEVPAVDPAAIGLATLAPLAGVVSRIPPGVLAAAVAGFVYGMRAREK